MAIKHAQQNRCAVKYEYKKTYKKTTNLSCT